MHETQDRQVIIFWGAIGLGLLALGVALFLTKGSYLLEASVSTASGLMLIALFILRSPEVSRTRLGHIIARTIPDSLVTNLAFLGIIGLFLYAGTRFQIRRDLTEDRLFKLSDRTVEFLEELDIEIHITGFFLQTDTHGVFLEDLLEEYVQYSDMLTYQFIDPELKPAAAQQYGINTYNVMVFETNEKTMEVFISDEHDLTRTLIKIVSPEREAIYFLAGHGERDPNFTGGSGFSQVREVLEQNNYRVEILNLATTSSIPVDAVLLVIAAPKSELQPEELMVIEDYISSRGNVMILQDPGAEETLESILLPFGLQFNNDIIVDPEKALFGVDALSPVVDQHLPTSITYNIAETVFFGARSVESDDSQDSATMRLTETSESSWGETDFQSVDPEFSDGDISGPLTIVMAVEQPELEGDVTDSSLRRTRIIVFGDSDFASNTGAVFVGNTDLFINSANWLAESGDLVSLRSQPLTVRRMLLQPQEARTILYVSSIFLPLSVLCVGAIIWWRQR